MTAPEAVEAVRGYLAHTGGSEERQIFLGLGAAVSRPMIRKALKALACRMRVMGDWTPPNPEAIERYVAHNHNHRKYDVVKRYDGGRFMVYSLPA